MAEAVKFQDEVDDRDYTPTAAVTGGEVVQLSDGLAAVLPVDLASGELGAAETDGVWTVAKTTSMVFLQGGPVYWDHSANKAHYKKVNDRDFYIGTAYDDAASADTTLKVVLNNKAQYVSDLHTDGYVTVLAGTAAAGAFGYPVALGVPRQFEMSATSEAQKVDALGLHGIAPGANFIVEGAFRVINDGSGTVVDVSMGVANATHATDADSITEHLFVHLDANNTTINLQSKDGTTTVAATDTTTTYTEGSAIGQRKEFWFDARDTTDIQCYIDGVLVLDSTAFKLSGATGPLFPLVHVEKTSSTDTYKLAVDWLRIRIMQEDNQV